MKKYVCLNPAIELIVCLMIFQYISNNVIFLHINAGGIYTENVILNLVISVVFSLSSVAFTEHFNHILWLRILISAVASLIIGFILYINYNRCIDTYDYLGLGSDSINAAACIAIHLLFSVICFIMTYILVLIKDKMPKLKLVAVISKSADKNYTEQNDKPQQ